MHRAAPYDDSARPGSHRANPDDRSRCCDPHRDCRAARSSSRGPCPAKPGDRRCRRALPVFPRLRPALRAGPGHRYPARPGAHPNGRAYPTANRFAPDPFPNAPPSSSADPGSHSRWHPETRVDLCCRNPGGRAVHSSGRRPWRRHSRRSRHSGRCRGARPSPRPGRVELCAADLPLRVLSLEGSSRYRHARECSREWRITR